MILFYIYKWQSLLLGTVDWNEEFQQLLDRAHITNQQQLEYPNRNSNSELQRLQQLQSLVTEFANLAKQIG